MAASQLRNGVDLTVRDLDRSAADCPVSGGCHRAATGNISIFADCDRATFEAIRISNGNSFVHETESQLILNG